MKNKKLQPNGFARRNVWENFQRVNFPGGFHLFDENYIVFINEDLIITILWDIVEWRRIRSLNEMANNSDANFSDPLHWFRWLLWLLLLEATSPCPLLIPWLWLLCMLLIKLLKLFALLRISSSHKCYINGVCVCVCKWYSFNKNVCFCFHFDIFRTPRYKSGFFQQFFQVFFS